VSESQVIYARVPKEVREAVGTHAADQGQTITGAVVELLRSGLKRESGPRIIDLDYLEEIADIMAARMELAVVQRVPRELVELFGDGINCQVELYYGVPPPSQVILKYVRRGAVLELEFWVNGGYRVATFRFQST